jgi:hypothetical protein
VRDNAGTAGVDTLVDVERVAFLDRSVALDLQGNAGITAKILGAVFGKSFLTNKEFVGIGLDLLDSGVRYEDLVGLAVQTSQFAQLAGTPGALPSNTATKTSSACCPARRNWRSTWACSMVAPTRRLPWPIWLAKPASMP